MNGPVFIGLVWFADQSREQTFRGGAIGSGEKIVHVSLQKTIFGELSFHNWANNIIKFTVVN